MTEDLAAMPEFNSPKNWPEDYEHENGNYICRCSICKGHFYGHKRRVVCKECQQLKTEKKEDKSTLERFFEDSNKNKIEALQSQLSDLQKENEKLYSLMRSGEQRGVAKCTEEVAMLKAQLEKAKELLRESIKELQNYDTGILSEEIELFLNDK